MQTISSFDSALCADLKIAQLDETINPETGELLIASGTSGNADAAEFAALISDVSQRVEAKPEETDEDDGDENTDQCRIEILRIRLALTADARDHFRRLANQRLAEKEVLLGQLEWVIRQRDFWHKRAMWSVPVVCGIVVLGLFLTAR